MLFIFFVQTVRHGIFMDNRASSVRNADVFRVPQSQQDSCLSANSVSAVAVVCVILEFFSLVIELKNFFARLFVLKRQ